ncbi:alpha-galactosidase [Arachidicoccus terrestris]|uniref:alpha-galactosidase n=1 Tax=Arachidicoccus terrestris TaxID=2875539 RepID=UPI001CC724F0|nr:alpha-galactosidase [Arachidicoccus terrestris]UAY57191.1 alpha-galactosidase [Arachidicoccus terrestris]
MTSKFHTLISCILCVLIAGPAAVAQQNITISTDHCALVYQIDTNRQLQQIYIGTKLISQAAYRDVNADFRNENPTLGMGFPTGGATYLNEPAMEVQHADGNMSLVLNVEHVQVKKINDDITRTDIQMKDPVYPFWITLHFESYAKEDVITTRTTIHHNEDAPVILDRFASAFINIDWNNPYLTHFYGEYEKEMEMSTAKLQPGIFSIQSKLGVRTACNYNPSFFITPQQAVKENEGAVFAGTLAYSGNFNIQFEQLQLNIDMGNSLRIIPGINAYASHYRLQRGEVFETPKFVFSYTQKGLGQISRNFHRWAINYGIYNGRQKRLTLLNNWEATYFDYNQDKLVNLFDGAKKLGVDMFLLDDGWFGNTYPRNNSSAGLGDWQANKKKLPSGIGYLSRQATAKGLKFGIWIEPEMINPSSELYKKHPDWVLAAPNRPKHLYRTQLVLDLINPAVQDFVFGVIDSLMQQAPSIAYMKWDCNRSMDNAYSPYLGKEQNALYIRYTQAYYKVLDRIRKKYPDLQMMLCASGGGRVEYGALKYFQEFWPSDNTYPVDRIRLQWATSIFYPALTICAHVTAAGRESLKYKMDVAMSGKLGFDIDVQKLSSDQLALARQTVDNYLQYQPVINYGDLYRLVSPYTTNFSSLMYVDSTKSTAILFAYSMETMQQDTWPEWKLYGLDPQKSYRIKEINLPDSVHSSFKEDGRVFSGESLIHQGLKWFLKRKEQSAVFILEAI